MESIWKLHTTIEPREKLKKDIRTQVAIIGGGMTGILLADRLKKAGKAVVVLEADRIGSGQTAGTTAKITAQHGLIYRSLSKRYGIEKAKLYANGHIRAIEEYRRLVTENTISCDWQDCCSYLYSQKDRSRLEAEALAAVTLGMPVSFNATTSLPFEVSGAVRMEKQAMFNPLAFLQEISRGLTVYEHTPVIKVEEKQVVTPKAIVTADFIVFACHFPFVDTPGLYYMRMHQERALVLALKDAAPLKDMYYGIDKNALSLRPYKEYLLVGGESYRTGSAEKERYDALERKARMWFPESKVITKWSAQDCMPARDIPYIGRFSQSHLNWFIATGYRKWGMTTAMVAAMLLCDMICSKENPMEELYAPYEFSAQEIPQIAKDGCKTVGNYLSYAVPSMKKEDKLRVGEGGAVGFTRGAYKDAHMQLHTVTLRCPHRGCKLHWNKEEKTWECPCHGSRFNHHGKRISGPARNDIRL